MTASAQQAQEYTGVWEFESWATEGWPAEPPFSAAGRAAQEEWAANPQNDPSMRCYIPLGRIISAPFPHEVLYGQNRMTFLYEYDHQVRRIWMDGREHPGSYPTLMGHTIGYWDSATLVLETTELEAGLFRPQGYPYSESLRLIERYTLLDDGTRMLAEFVIDDPEYYSETWTVERHYRRSEEGIKDYECIVREHLSAG